MSRELLWHAESEAVFEVFTEEELCDAVDQHGCEIVSGKPRFENQFEMEKAMSDKVVTIKRTFTRDQLTGTRNPLGNELLAGQVIFGWLRAQGVPVIGVLGVLAVEWGTLSVVAEDGLDGDEWTWTFVGKRMPKEWIDRCAQPGAALRLDKPLAQMIAEEDEL